MYLIDAVLIWEMNHPNIKYLDNIAIHQSLDKDVLMDHILMECGDLKVIDCNSELFHKRVEKFFAIHKWNIDKLCDSMEFVYNPLDNYHGKQIKFTQRDVETDSVTNRDQTDDTVTDRDQTRKETTARDVSTVEDGTKDQTIHDDTVTDRDWSETGTSDEQDVHYVSAYNDKESPERIGTDSLGRPIYKYNDTEHDRDSIDIGYKKNGTEDIGVVQDKTVGDIMHSDEVVDEDVTVDDRTEEDITVKTVTGEDIHKNDVTDEDINETTNKSGNYGKTYQSMIEEERKQAQFNIYKWILNHWFHEMIVSVW